MNIFPIPSQEKVLAMGHKAPQESCFQDFHPSRCELYSFRKALKAHGWLGKSFFCGIAVSLTLGAIRSVKF